MEIRTMQDAVDYLNSGETSVMVTGRLRLAGFHIMHYHGRRIFAHKNQVEDFVFGGLECCEGCERDRFLNLFSQLEGGRFHIYDVLLDGDEDFYDTDDPIITYDAWQLEGELLMKGAM